LCRNKAAKRPDGVERFQVRYRLLYSKKPTERKEDCYETIYEIYISNINAGIVIYRLYYEWEEAGEDW
jgi:hypothetical protein